MEKIKLTKDVFLSSVIDDGEQIEAFLVVKLFGIWKVSILSFERNFQKCNRFKTFCRTVGISQKKMTNIIHENL
jgi:hypothetical protein